MKDFQGDVLSMLLTLTLLLLIFSPLIFSRRQVESRIEFGWKHVLKSKWFGIPFIFLLLLTDFSTLTLGYILIMMVSALMVSFSLSFIVHLFRTQRFTE
ncbi:hypothetical protein RYX56_00485 [Alkalihalophilus lindianensis]|uniref:Uncharacterized protein n=1 Tax=Alkalihalophilus lindianensis TaxID=1630542 RepID=A0ABU3X4L8_9BACI|nr:hypothetical protein [Alkalihalophilus lindianensis]MDV2682840.1 hypothetical protein [Alkalihalophilus lindianensis]